MILNNLLQHSQSSGYIYYLWIKSVAYTIFTYKKVTIYIIILTYNVLPLHLFLYWFSITTFTHIVFSYQIKSNLISRLSSKTKSTDPKLQGIKIHVTCKLNPMRDEFAEHDSMSPMLKGFLVLKQKAMWLRDHFRSLVWQKTQNCTENERNNLKFLL